MKLVHAISLILVEFGAGILLMLPLVPITEVRKSFFTFHSLLTGVCLGLAAAVHGFALSSISTAIGLSVAAILCFATFGTAQMERNRDTRILHIVTAFIAVFFGMIITIPPPKAGAVLIYWWPVTTLLGAVVLGAVHNAMALGHWYLLSRNLSFEYLIRITKVLLAVLILRTVFLVAAILMLPHLAPDYSQIYFSQLFSVNGNMMFFLMRVMWGLALPIVLAVMSWRCAVGKANQAATGLLYLCEVSVLFGELFAAYLMI